MQRRGASAAFKWPHADTQTSSASDCHQNLVSSSTPPAISSVSYGECETVNGAAANAAFNPLISKQSQEGTSVYVASGDRAPRLRSKSNGAILASP